jgi:hypothetical protein
MVSALSFDSSGRTRWRWTNSNGSRPRTSVAGTPLRHLARHLLEPVSEPRRDRPAELRHLLEHLQETFARERECCDFADSDDRRGARDSEQEPHLANAPRHGHTPQVDALAAGALHLHDRCPVDQDVERVRRISLRHDCLARVEALSLGDLEDLGEVLRLESAK